MHFMSKDQLQPYQPKEEEKIHNSAAREAVKKLLDAEVGDTVEISVRMLGPIALAYRQGVRPRFDDDGKIIVDLKDIQVGGLKRNMSVMDMGEYDSATDYLYHWSGDVFFTSFVSAVTRALASLKKEEFDQSVASSFRKRIATSARYFLEGVGYGDIPSFLDSLIESIRVGLTGKTPGYDSKFSFVEWRQTAADMVSSCFVVDENDVSVYEGSDEGQRAVIAVIKVKKVADFPLDQSKLSDFLYELDY